MKQLFKAISASFGILLILSLSGMAQSNLPEPELALSLKLVPGQIRFGANEFYVTEADALSIQPGLRYDHPLPWRKKKEGSHFIVLSLQGGFLFCKAKQFDSTYFHPRNPAYFPMSVGLYNRAAFSVGTEIFYWKGLGNRDIAGVKFLSLGYNGYGWRCYVAGEYYRQIRDGSMNGVLVSFEVMVNLIRGSSR